MITSDLRVVRMSQMSGQLHNAIHRAPDLNRTAEHVVTFN